VDGGKNLKSLSLGFRVWREIEKELLVGGHKYLKVRVCGLGIRRERKKEFVSRW
jgi:hypothetical protein